jgi:pyruvate dehydrogenase E2 component (dihydrolipoamide acetyltransferase)
VAVDTEAGLLVPVIHHVAALGLRDIAARSRKLVERARARKLAAADLRGGVFTVTTLGAFGIDAFTPIINYPECAILGVGKVRREPCVVGEQIVVRQQVTFSLTFDHRAMDGATAARFLQTFCELVRSPAGHLNLEA